MSMTKIETLPIPDKEYVAENGLKCVYCEKSASLWVDLGNFVVGWDSSVQSACPEHAIYLIENSANGFIKAPMSAHNWKSITRQEEGDQFAVTQITEYNDEIISGRLDSYTITLAETGKKIKIWRDKVGASRITKIEYL